MIFPKTIHIYAIIIVSLICIGLFLFPRISVNFDDMSPTLQSERRSFCLNSITSNHLIRGADVVTAFRAAYWFRPPSRDDVILFIDRTSHTAPVRIQRIIGLPGDTIKISNGIVYANEKPSMYLAVSNFIVQQSRKEFVKIQNIRLPGSAQIIERFNSHKANHEISSNGIWAEVNYMLYTMPSITLSNNEYFLLGDNVAFAHDSRIFGPIKKRFIIGPVIHVHKPALPN